MVGNRQFVLRDFKGSTFPAIGGFDLDKARSAIGGETLDIVSEAIPIFVRNPAYLSGEVIATRAEQCCTFVLQYAFFTSSPQSTIAFVSSRNVEFSGDMKRLLQFLRGWLIGMCGRRSDPDRRGLTQ